MTNVRYEDLSQAGGIPRLTVVETELHSGANRQVVAVRNPSDGTALQTAPGDGPNLDAFGRVRVADTGQRADVEFTYDLLPLVMESITAGGATITHNAATRDVTLAIGDANNNTGATFPLGYHVPYTPGCGQLIDITGTLDYAGLGGGTAGVFVRNNGTDTVITQANWNQSTVEDMDWSKSQIFTLDFQSLKVGRIRFGLVRNGVPVIVHEVYNDNVRANGYWQYPNQPLTWRIHNTGGNTIAEIGYFDGTNGIGFRYSMPANAGAQCLAICGTVKSEAGEDLFDIPGLPFSAGNGATGITVATTVIPLLSIQLKATFNSIANRGLVVPTDLTFVNDQPIEYRLVLNPSLTGASWTSADNNSLVNYDVSATALSGGTVVSRGYVSAGGNRPGAQRVGFTGRVPLSVDYAGTTGDILTIAAVRFGSVSATAGCSIDWREVR